MLKSKKNFLIALEASGGNISLACKKIGICRGTYYKWFE